MTSSNSTMACPKCHAEFTEDVRMCPHDGSMLVLSLPDPMLKAIFAERYEIQEVLGRGGMSVVYKAKQLYIENLVAIKILHPNLGVDPAALERFKLEAKTASTIKHPNVIQVIDFGFTSDHQAFLIMEYLEGKSLGEYLEKHRTMPVERALGLFTQACEGLTQAHAKGVIHRDLKPGNLIIGNEPDGDLVKIVDFGIAKMLSANAQSLTQPGEVFGSPLYMSPEQCQAKPLDARSDIYSLGCVMYETLSGKPPLMGINSFETMNKHVKEHAQPLNSLVLDKKIPPAVDAVILKALNKSPERRHQTMVELKRELLEAAYTSELVLPDIQRIYQTSSGGQAFEGAGERQSTSAALQKTILDAVEVTRKQDRKNKQLRKVIIALYCLVGLGVVAAALELSKPGPPSDPAPVWARMIYLAQMRDAEIAKASLQWREAAKHYRDAVAASSDFGDSTDKRMRALLGLLTSLENSKGSSEDIDHTRTALLNASLRHMEAIYNESPEDIPFVTDLDEGMLQRIGPDKLDNATADGYARELVDNARSSYKRHNYVKAISWLREALEMEEAAHRKSPGVADALKEYADAAEAKVHKAEIEDLLHRAEAAGHIPDNH